VALLALGAACRHTGGGEVNEEVKRAMAQAVPQVMLQAGQLAIDLVFIPPGDFIFGSPETERERRASEVPARRVRMSHGYYLGRTEVTQRQWRAVMGSLPQQPPGDDLPVAQVSYRDAVRFCEQLSALAAVRVRLPTEAEWEYACRAGTTTRYWSGDGEADLSRAGWYRGNSDDRAHPVGTKPANPWGLMDMHGNVWEYMSDYIQDFDQLAAVNPVGSRSDRRGAMRGGGWMHEAADCRAATRLVSSDRFGGAGLRIAVDP
jgi:formylglycine-generating enzyme required for sulfatase activity